MGEDIYDKYKRMNFAELRKYLKDQRTLQKLYYFLPAALSLIMILGYCLQGWGSYPSMVDEMNQQKTIHADLSTFSVYDWVVTLLLIPFLPYEKTHIKFDFASSLLMGAYVLVKFLLFGSFDPLTAVVVIYFFLVALHLRVICKRIVFIKSLPDYPFLPSVELERQRELEMQKYSQNNQINQKLIKQAEKKVEGTLEEKMEQLPKRHIEKYRISRGEFDDTEEDYSDKLIGEEFKNSENIPTEFEDINEKYQEDIKSSEDKLTMDRREHIDEIEGAYEDYTAQHTDRFAPDMIDEASVHHKSLEKKQSPDKNQTPEDMVEDNEYEGDLPKFAPHTYAEFENEEEGYTDETFGNIKDHGIINDEKPEKYKPVV